MKNSNGRGGNEGQGKLQWQGNCAPNVGTMALAATRPHRCGVCVVVVVVVDAGKVNAIIQ